MSRVILVRGARQLLTLHGPAGPRRGADLRNLGIIQDGSILIADGLIREVGPTRRIENLALARNAHEINAAGKVVLPGFVDSHTHLATGPARLADYEMHLAGATRAQIGEAGGGWQAMYRSLPDLSAATLESQSWRVLREAIRQGTTMLESRSGSGINETGELKILRTHAALNRRFHNVASTFMAARFLPPGLFPDAAAYLEWMANTMLPLVRRRKLAEFFDVYCEEGPFTLEQTRRLLTRACDLGFGLKMHTGQHWNIGGARLAVEAGAISVDHAIYLDRDDIAALANSPTIVTLLPGPVFFLGLHRYASARSLIDRGAAVALATNYNPETCPTSNMQMIVALACRKMNMTPAEAIAAATINGAYAMCRGDLLGSLEARKQADLIMLSVSDYREIPYYFGVNLVEMTMQRGQIIYQAAEVVCPSN